MNRRPRVAKLSDVAEAAGVSVAAVSRYLGGSLTLSVETAARIDAAVQKLKYRPNPHARSLSRGRSETIGLVLPDISNPFFGRMAAGVEAAVGAHGYGLVLCATLNRPGRELEYLERLRRNYLDGLIFMTNHVGDRDLARAINRAGLVVLADEDVGGAKAHKIFCENENGAYLATRHLLEAGHRRIAFLGSLRGLLTTEERLAGYRRAIRELGPSAQSIGEFFGEYTIESGREATEKLIAAGTTATAVFYNSDQGAVGGLNVLHRYGLRVPDDVSVVAFDDVEPLHLFGPPITAIKQPVDEIGKRSVEAVIARLKNNKLKNGVQRLPVTLIERESVAPPHRPRRRMMPRAVGLSAVS